MTESFRLDVLCKQLLEEEIHPQNVPELSNCNNYVNGSASGICLLHSCNIVMMTNAISADSNLLRVSRMRQN